MIVKPEREDFVTSHDVGETLLVMFERHVQGYVAWLLANEREKGKRFRLKTGWICPRCKQVYAPTVDRCKACRPMRQKT